MSTQVSLQNSAFGGVITGEGKANFELPLSKILEDLFIVLSEKEKQVIIARYSLDNKPKRTLESIGQKFNVTRERIRQIENIGLSKLRRVFQNTKLRLLSDFAKESLNKNGGIQREDELVDFIFDRIENAEDVDKHIIGLALKVDPELSKQDKSDQFVPFWRFINISMQDIKSILQEGVNLIRAKKDTIEEDVLVPKIMEKLGINEEKTTMVKSLLKVDKRLKNIPEGWGLMSMRWVNPKSIRDKALIVLRKDNKPLHFKDLAEKIKAYHFDNKEVTTQAVHNELIRYDQFVLMGRGLYALKEWGYDHGTVADVIKAVLKKSGRPMTKQEIINEVLKQRKVKLGTISLNLQNTDIFKRLDRAVYTLQEGVV